MKERKKLRSTKPELAQFNSSRPILVHRRQETDIGVIIVRGGENESGGSGEWGESR